MVYFKEFKPKTSMELTFKEVKALNFRAIISQNGAVGVLLLLMVFGIFYYDSMCKNYSQEEEYDGTIDSAMQVVCQHKSGFVLNISVAFLALTALRRFTKKTPS